jgi:hypothetical protein
VDVDSPYPLVPGARAAYARDGFVRLPGVLAPATLARFRPELRAKVALLNTLQRPMEERTTYERAFLQVMNLWAQSDVVRQLVFGKRLARIASELMGVRGVRLYHDQALYKEPGGGHTPWHADQYYWPLATSLCCTAWIPLQDTPLEMGPVAFSAGSHRVEVGRDLPISDESEAGMARALEAAGLPTLDVPPRGAQRHHAHARGDDGHLHGRGHAPRRAEEPQPGARPGSVVPRGGGRRDDRDAEEPRPLPLKRVTASPRGLAVTPGLRGGSDAPQWSDLSTKRRVTVMMTGVGTPFRSVGV